MAKTITHILFVLTMAFAGAFAQEKPTPPKPQPEQRAVPVTFPDTSLKPSARDTAAKPSQSLPKFDLPEYVITGVVPIDLPDVEKQQADEPAPVLELPNPLESPRDRSTVEFAADEKEGFIPARQLVSKGMLQASIGTYLTSAFGLWLSKLDPEFSLQGDLQYGVSSAFVPFSNRSGGQLNVIGGVTLHGLSESYNGGTLRGGLGFGSEVYRFYGSLTPSVTRTVSRFRLSAGADSPRNLVYNYTGTAALAVTGLSDSSSSVTETQFRFGIESNLLVGSFPIDGRLDLAFASVSGSGEATLPYVEASIIAPKHWFKDFFAQGSANLYLTQGMHGQKLVRLYPHVSIGYRIHESSIISLAYTGRVQYNTLAGLVELQPYLSATDTVRQSDLPFDITGSFETNWNESWRTRFSAHYQSVRDYPLLTVGGQKGVWATSYIGTTMVTTFEAELFAKFAANDYLALSAEINSSKNSVRKWEVPYLPDFRLNGAMSFEVLGGLRIVPSVTYVGARVVDLYVASKLKEYFLLGLRGEYLALKSLAVFLDCKNLSDATYEEWSGYRATPFIIAAGLSVRW